MVEKIIVFKDKLKQEIISKNPFTQVQLFEQNNSTISNALIIIPKKQILYFIKNIKTQNCFFLGHTFLPKIKLFLDYLL